MIRIEGALGTVRADRKPPRVLALGTFDGVHRGHQELIRRGKALARESGSLLRVCTFDRHPLEILRPEAAPRMLTTEAEQAARMDPPRLSGSGWRGEIWTGRKR